jgi:hypothetical protein
MAEGSNRRVSAVARLSESGCDGFAGSAHLMFWIWCFLDRGGVLKDFAKRRVPGNNISLGLVIADLYISIFSSSVVDKGVLP